MILVRHFRLRTFPYKRTRQLAETLAKRAFQRQQLLVFRGSFFGSKEEFEVYPHVKSHYDFLEEMVIRKAGYAQYHAFCSYCQEQRGEPDYIVYDKIADRLTFVEVKFKHEVIKKHQLQCMKQAYFFLKIPSEIWRFSDPKDRVVQEVIELPSELPSCLTQHKKVVKKEMKLTAFI